MALASSLRDIVHSVARLKFGSEKIFEFALVDGELTDAVRQFFHGHWVLIVLPAEFRFGHGFWFWQNGRGRHKLADHRLFTLLKLFQQVREMVSRSQPASARICSVRRKLAPITMVS